MLFYGLWMIAHLGFDDRSSGLLKVVAELKLSEL